MTADIVSQRLRHSAAREAWQPACLSERENRVKTGVGLARRVIIGRWGVIRGHPVERAIQSNFLSTLCSLHAFTGQRIYPFSGGIVSRNRTLSAYPGSLDFSTATFKSLSQSDQEDGSTCPSFAIVEDYRTNLAVPSNPLETQTRLRRAERENSAGYGEMDRPDRRTPSRGSGVFPATFLLP